MALPLLSAGALAAPCGQPDLLEAIPPDETQGVPTNASLLARYAPGAEYLGEDVVLQRVGDEPEVALATFDPSQGLLSIKPQQPLLPGGEYVVRWPGLRGLASATIGRGAEVRFTAGGGPDSQAPSFEGAVGLDWNVLREENDCTESLEERYAFDLALAEPADDGGRASLTLIVFQAMGPHITDGPLPVMTGAMPPPGRPLRIALATGNAVGPVCFATIVRDLTGKTSSSGDRQVCVKTVAPPFFQGCAVGGGAQTSARPAMTLLLVAVGLVIPAVLRPRRSRG
jgi:hypothetical protein